MAREPLGVVLTAGLGTRLRPITPATPKPLVPLLNRPLIVYALDLLASLGLREIAVVVGPEDTTTAEVARSHAPPGVEVSGAVQREPNGPGDAVASVGAALEERPQGHIVPDEAHPLHPRDGRRAVPGQRPQFAMPGESIIEAKPVEAARCLPATRSEPRPATAANCPLATRGSRSIDERSRSRPSRRKDAGPRQWGGRFPWRFGTEVRS